MKITFWTYVRNCGDGSNYIAYFNSQEEAERYAENDSERYCDDIEKRTLNINEKNGIILNPDVKPEWLFRP